MAVDEWFDRNVRRVKPKKAAPKKVPARKKATAKEASAALVKAEEHPPVGLSRLFEVELLVDARGVTHPAPNRWRYADDPHAMAAVQAFYIDLIWAFTYELEGVRWWPAEPPKRLSRPSLTAALGDLALIWGLDAVGPHSGPRQYHRNGVA